jgi:DNA-binding NarL/FixJ family response regulator
MTAATPAGEEEPAKSGPAEARGNQHAVSAAKPISPRQRDVLDCVRRGLSNKEIARELDIAEGTVKIHLAALFSHFGARNRTELATKS